MKFDWSKFIEADYDSMLNNKKGFGMIYVGDICIELVLEFNSFISSNLFIAHEDTGYGYKDKYGNVYGVNIDGECNDCIPYDFVDGIDLDIPYDLSYEEFKEEAEKLFEKYITDNDKLGCQIDSNGNLIEYSLVEHANRPLEIW